MREKTVLITGGNAGIGRATAQRLARQGHTVIIAGRDGRKLDATAQCIRFRSPRAKVHILLCDLADLASVRTAAQRFRDEFPSLDVLINNAGIFSNFLRLSADGFEMQFATNHLGHFALTHHLLPSLRAARRPRVVNLTSVAHFKGKMDFDNLRGEKGARTYDGLAAYAQSKLANVLFTRELARRHPELSANCLHPGVIRTRIGNKNTRWNYNLMWELYKPFMRSSLHAAGCIQYMAFSPELNDVSGRYFDEYQCCRKPAPAAQDPELAQRLWDLSQEFSQVDAH